ncbi:MAG: RNA 2',3'-cyclic phosphodiesterase [Candidatus Methylomirabilia bacterium]
MSEQIRSFVAILLNEAVRTAIASELDQIRPLARSVGWVAPPNLHLTLKFLGRLPVDTVKAVEGALGAVVGEMSPFSMVFQGLGAFPGVARPRVLWVGVVEGVRECQALARLVEDTLARSGLPQESRPYTPHVTIGRVRKPGGLSALQQAISQDAHKPFGQLEVRALSLMRSDLHPDGARYTELRAFPFAG